MRYGTPYKGSKNAIIPDLIKAIPHHGYDCFVDLFAGGCSVTHAMILRQWFPHLIANDLDGKGVELFRRAVAGEYHDETRWISRDDFFRLKDTDPYVALCWSFGNNTRNYLYSQEIEPWKHALHLARVFGDRAMLREFGIEGDGSRADVAAHHDEYQCKYIRWWLSQQQYTVAELDALIERTKGNISVQKGELRQYLLAVLKDSGLTQAEVQRRLGTQMVRHYFGRSQWEFPTQEMYERMQTFMPGLNQDYNAVIGLHNLWQRLQSLESLQSLQILQSLQRLQRLQSLQSLQILQSLQRLQRLQSLQSLESLESKSRIAYTKFDYRQVEIPSNSVVYCDIPYKNTDGYSCKRGANPFDHEAFYDWCAAQASMVVISEYSMPEDRFTCVWQRAHRSRLSATANNAVTECLFVPKGREAEYYKLINLIQQPTLFSNL